MKKVALIIIFIAGIIGVGYYLWMHRYEYFFQGEEPYELNKETNEMDSTKEEDFKESLGDEGGWEELDDEEDEDDESDEDISYDAPAVTKEDCDNRCDGFDNEEEKEYCMEICGLTEGQRDTNNCEKMKAVKRDSCFKQKAINNKDTAYCEKIIDEDLQKNCQNRVIEELLD